MTDELSDTGCRTIQDYYAMLAANSARLSAELERERTQNRELREAKQVGWWGAGWFWPLGCKPSADFIATCMFFASGRGQHGLTARAALSTQAGIVQVEKGDPRYCPIDVQHEPHRYEYRFEEHGDAVTGWYDCDGFPTWPLSTQEPTDATR